MGTLPTKHIQLSQKPVNPDHTHTKEKYSFKALSVKAMQHGAEQVTLGAPVSRVMEVESPTLTICAQPVRKLWIQAHKVILSHVPQLDKQSPRMCCNES